MNTWAPAFELIAAMAGLTGALFDERSLEAIFTNWNKWITFLNVNFVLYTSLNSKNF